MGLKELKGSLTSLRKHFDTLKESRCEELKGSFVVNLKEASQRLRSELKSKVMLKIFELT